MGKAAKTFTYRASEDELRELERKARFRRISKSALLRELVRQAPGPTEDEAKREPTDAAVEAALRVRGTLSADDYEGVKESIRRTGAGWVR